MSGKPLRHPLPAFPFSPSFPSFLSFAGPAVELHCGWGRASGSAGTLVLPELTWELAGFERLGPLCLALVSGKPLRRPCPAFPFSPSFPSFPSFPSLAGVALWLGAGFGLCWDTGASGADLGAGWV